MSMNSAKEIIKNYSYVFIPVHLIVTGSTAVLFNYLLKNEFDFAGILERMHASEDVINILHNPKIGNITLVVILLKLVSPLRWLLSITTTVTLVKIFRKRCSK